MGIEIKVKVQGMFGERRVGGEVMREEAEIRKGWIVAGSCATVWI